jgi:uncharacterized RDD family membrane protein YckC
MTDGITTSTGVTLGYASRGTRLLGQGVDGLIAASPMIAVAILSQFNQGLGAPLIIPAAICIFLYHAFADGLHQGQSVAKQWLGMRVVDARTGAPCTFFQSFVRNVLAILGPLDWIFIFGEQHQRLGDKAAGTIVVVAD